MTLPKEIKALEGGNGEMGPGEPRSVGKRVATADAVNAGVPESNSASNTGTEATPATGTGISAKQKGKGKTNAVLQ